MARVSLTIVLFLFLLLFFSFSDSTVGQESSTCFSIVPRPASVKQKPGHFTIDHNTMIFIAEQDIDLMHSAILLSEQVRMAGGPALSVGVLSGNLPSANAILFQYAKNLKTLPEEGYRLVITPKQILLTGNSGAGLFYGIQTLFQLMPPELFREKHPEEGLTWEIPCADIRDYPRFPYRGMHLDVSRHFFPPSFIKRYIDLLSMYKMNVFHWHLTDDNGWRIEIKKYPELTKTAAWRVDRENLSWDNRPPREPGEKTTYGGFYTQEEIKDIVEYAAQRYVTIIPEIEMPAHSIEVLAAYPHLSCTGGPFDVPPGSYWPNSDILCAGNDSVFTFLEDVLTEVMALFPSQYIHIGGDEADKTRWESCVKCQQRMKEEGLKNEEELQSYFIQRVERFVNSQGRHVIGWDEIIEGGLAPGATVMSWRGVEGGIEAARSGHDVIMTPTSHCYFDYYQSDPEFEPEGIGGLTTLKQVYSFEPIPEELTTTEAHHVLGAQGNLWTEYISTPSHAEYMAVPRMLALAEVDWTPAKIKNWENFRQRIETQFERLSFMGVNFSKGSFNVEIQPCFDKKNNQVLVTLSSEQPDIQIRYTTNGNDPTPASALYVTPFAIAANAYIKAALFINDTLKGKPAEKPIIFHQAIGKPVTYLNPWSIRYPASGSTSLTNGIRGGINHRDGNWQGFLGNDLSVIIDLKKEMSVKSVSITFLQNVQSWIFFPVMVSFSLSSDGKHWHSVYEKRGKVPEQTSVPMIQPFSNAYPEGETARYIKVEGFARGDCPEWHDGKGNPCWIFADEIVVY